MQHYASMVYGIIVCLSQDGIVFLLLKITAKFQRSNPSGAPNACGVG